MEYAELNRILLELVELLESAETPIERVGLIDVLTVFLAEIKEDNLIKILTPLPDVAGSTVGGM